MNGFKCLGCGTCCGWPGYVYVTDEEANAMARQLGIGRSEFRDEFTLLAPNRGQLCLKQAPGGVCIFLHENRCRVYPVRPRQCRDFPTKWGRDARCPACRIADVKG